MKKVIFLIISFLFFIPVCSASVKLDKCVDGDTTWFIIDGVRIKVRFLAIDTPESTNKIEKYGKEASVFTCNKLKKATKIELEYEDNKIDKYNRTLAWVFVDDELLQSILVRNGYARVAYLYDDYKYTDIILKDEKYAKEKKLNIWSSNTNYYYLYFGIIIVIIILILKRKH